jgi:exodeoxyribonuclease VII small subunit
MASSSRSPTAKPQDRPALAALADSQDLIAADPDGSSASAESFETAVSELDALVQKMESGELSLEQSLAAYQRGAQLVQFCQKTLSGVQKQVKILEAGLFKPFEEVQDPPDAE